MRFAAAGASVIANYVRDESAARSFRDEARAAGYEVTTCRADLTSSKGIATLIQAVGAESGRLSILVHCAATGVHKPIADLQQRHFDWTYALNVRAFLDLVQQLIPFFDVPASVLAISSEGAARTVPYYSLVGSSKAALESLVRYFAVELAPRGIRVNCLSAGPLMTEAWKVLPESDHRLADAIARSPLRRLNTLDEVANAAQFLCSDAAAGIVGHCLVVDGGKSLPV
jgi:enoyl-[acyl-carrier protein] reductase III